MYLDELDSRPERAVDLERIDSELESELFGKAFVDERAGTESTDSELLNSRPAREFDFGRIGFGLAASLFSPFIVVLRESEFIICAIARC
jgi:hypothetical protein